MKKIVLNALAAASAATTSPAHAASSGDPVVHAATVTKAALATISPCWRGDARVAVRRDGEHEFLILTSDRKIGQITLEVFETSAGTEVRYGDIVVARISEKVAEVDEFVLSRLRAAFA